MPGPLLAFLDGDVAVVRPDERHRRVPVPGRQVEAGEVRDVGVVRLQLLAGGDHLVERRRDLDAGRLEEVLAVDHDAGAGVVGHAVQRVVVRAGIEQALHEVVAAELGSPVAEVDECPRRLERLHLRVAELDDIGRVAARQRRRLALHDARPLLTLELDLDVRVDLVELGDGVLDHRVGRVGLTVQPEADGAALAAAAEGDRRWVGRWRRLGRDRRFRALRRIGTGGGPVGGLGCGRGIVVVVVPPHAATRRPAVTSTASDLMDRLLFTLSPVLVVLVSGGFIGSPTRSRGSWRRRRRAGRRSRTSCGAR